MGEKLYDKLIRDNIPEIIARDGGRAEVRTLNEAEYRAYLTQKLLEEAAEYKESGESAELADVVEVVYALAALNGLSREGLEELRAAKANKNGTFEKRLLLTKVIK